MVVATGIVQDTQFHFMPPLTSYIRDRIQRESSSVSQLPVALPTFSVVSQEQHENFSYDLEGGLDFVAEFQSGASVDDGMYPPAQYYGQSIDNLRDTGTFPLVRHFWPQLNVLADVPNIFQDTNTGPPNASHQADPYYLTTNPADVWPSQEAWF